MDLGKCGRSCSPVRTYVIAALTIRMVFHLPLRQTDGFLRSLAQLLKVDLPRVGSDRSPNA
ncbi:MAG: transposase [Longimicrobiales bacterium]